MIDLAGMAERYLTARDIFLSNASAAGWQVESIAHPLQGPDGITLHTDIASAGNPDSDYLLMVTSGTHGIEGYLGSEIQSRLLAEGIVASGSRDCHAVMVHAVNPYGFAWHRRVNEDNVDLNRNFIDFDLPLPVNEGYEEFYSLLNPVTWNEQYEATLKSEAAAAIARLGLGPLFKAVSGGQYEYPKGLQYGGGGPSWSRQNIEAIWSRMMTRKKCATQIDIHTGLGEPGVGVLMTYGAEEQARIRRARTMWTDIFVSPLPGSGDVITQGVLGPRLEEMFPREDVLAVVLEYGTLPPVDVLHAIAADNWLHHHGRVDSDTGSRIKQIMLDAFYLDDTNLREKAYSRAKDVVAAAGRRI
ncbi:MAG: DUF2817 domain-containing protein [Parvibaculum sp.]|uniref:DUF2817 domain-containing protein n=1 Tax=Parvibaculum sp. TaxID=2024848 RepID=UPI002ABCD2A4|nr:DUF2817 domain-containing protein [Parvibaculum sp.]MDZ4379878.1 DUF2817 domain-containing protein [Parvibaculum sp.]